MSWRPRGVRWEGRGEGEDRGARRSPSVSEGGGDGWGETGCHRVPQSVVREDLEDAVQV